MNQPNLDWPRRRIALWAVLLLASSWQVVVLVNSLRPAPDEINDFFQEWAAARFHLDGQPAYGNLETAAEHYLGWEDASNRDPRAPFNEVNAHPPTSVLLFLPLAYLDYRDACLAWNLVSFVFLAASFWIVARQLDLWQSPWALLPLVTVLLYCDPLRQQVAYGQLNLPLLLLIVGGWAAARSGRPWLGGALLAATAAVKLFPGFLFLYYLLRRDWKVLASGAVTFALLTGVTAAVLGPGVYEDYVREVLPKLEKYRYRWHNSSLAGFWYKLLDPASENTVPLSHTATAARAATLASWAVILACVAAIVLRAKSSEARDQAFGVTATAMLLVSPLTWNHYFVLLLVPVALLWKELPRGGAARTLFIVSLVALWLPPMAFWRLLIGAKPDDWWRLVARPWQTLTALSFHTYALLGVFGLGVYATWRADSSGKEGPLAVSR